MKKKTYIYILTTIFVLSLIPAYIIGFMDHPSVDDYYYGTATAEVFRNTSAFSAVLKESFKQMVNTYNDWQGNFAAIFLMRLQPGILGENYYFLTPVILITAFVASMIVFFYNFLRKWFRSDKSSAFAIALCITFTAFQFTYVPSDSFYWFNGSIYYTFFFSLGLILFTLVTITIRSENMPARIVSFIFALPLAFFIGGGNYSTALYTCILLVLFTLWHIVKKRKAAIYLATITLISILGLLISIIAPGNAIRQAAVGGNTGVIKALIYSFAYGGYNIANATTFPVAVLWILLLPLFYRIAKRSGFKFKYPLFVLLFSYAVYCSQGTPLFYAQGLRMPYRMMNIIYFNYYIFMTFNLLYLMGYIGRKFENSKFSTMIVDLTTKPKKFAIYTLCSVLLFLIGCIGLCRVSESNENTGNAAFTNMPLSVSATYSLVTGDAIQYDREINSRNELLLTTDEEDIVLDPLSVKPEVLFHTDITTDPTDWRNMHMSMFYKKVSVKLSK